MFLNIDKPKGITSHDVVGKLRRLTGIKKIGHAGTLDPNATGVLVVAIGRESTKKLGSLSKDTKKGYVAELMLGEERDTHDPEGIVTSNFEGKNIPTKEEIEKILDNFRGKIKQIPPKHSAIKIKGKKAYELARKGKDVKLKARDVNIYKAEILSYEWPLLNINFTVSSGTYIRALARDIGRDLDTGAYLSNLRRTKVGEFDIKGSVSLDKLTSDNWKDYSIE